MWAGTTATAAAVECKVKSYCNIVVRYTVHGIAQQAEAVSLLMMLYW